MINNLIDKYKNKDSWNGIVQLYSGLIESEQERYDFIHSLIDEHILLAAQCESSAIKKNTDLEEKIVEVAIDTIHNASNKDKIVESLKALTEFDKYHELSLFYYSGDKSKISFFKNITPDLLTFSLNKDFSSVLEAIFKAKSTFLIADVIKFI
ncbi:hypothetical protein ACFL35_05465, partial [Candidatus Riflebacteria bacterium]